MADPRSRHSGRRSPTFNPARASMPVNIGYNLPYTGELHATPATRYDPTAPRRHEPKTTPGLAPPTATVTTTYNVTKEPLSRSLSRSNRHRSSTVDSHSGKPIIVTTNHPRSHATSSHASGSVRTGSPSRETRDAYRSNDDAYYAVQPASSIRSRSSNRHSYHQGAPLSDEFYRLRERVAGTGASGTAVDDRFWGPSRTSTNNLHNPRPHVLYTTPAHTTHHATHAAHANHAAHATPAYPSTSAAVADFDDDYYEYTKPSELVRYDLDHDRDRRGRRDSIERSYYTRPHVNVVSHDTSRYEPRSRAKPPASGGLERYNRAAAAGAYDRPSVTMLAPPAVPPPPPIETSRRPALLEAPRDPPNENRTTRPRPVSLYQDGPTRPSLADDMYRSRDDERVGKDRRERDRDDGYRDDNVATRGFGIRTDTLDQYPARAATTLPVQSHDDRRPRHETTDRESRRAPDESSTRIRSHDRDTVDDYKSRTEESRDRRDGVGRRESVSRTRDKITAGLKGAAAAVLVPMLGRDEERVSPRRRTSDEEKDYDSRANETRYKETESAERKPSPRGESVVYEQRREPRRERAESVSGSNDREVKLDREPERESHRNREHSYEKDREGERSRVDERDDRDRHRHSEEVKPNGSSSDRREPSPDHVGRRKQRPVSAFDPTDTKGLMDLKAELAAIDGQSNGARKSDESIAASTTETGTTKTAKETNGSDKGDESDSRGREIVSMREEKQVRVVSPPRDKAESKPIKGILKAPSAKFPEDHNPIREGVAPHKDDKTKKDVPAGARWTKISRKKVNPEALTTGKERFEVRDDFVIVLRVLNKEEIQAYATATALIRAEKRRKELAGEARNERYSDEEQTRSDEERQRRHRHRQEKEEEEHRRGRAADDRHRRHNYDDDREGRPKTIEYHSGQHHDRR